MSNERANEFLSWRGQLTPPDALPEQGLEDRELTWQRLAERLEKKPARRGIAWWIAAGLLMAFLPATLFFRDRPARTSTRMPTRTHNAPPTHVPAPTRTPTYVAAHPAPTQIAAHSTPKSNCGEFATITSTHPHHPPSTTPKASAGATPAITLAAWPPLHDSAIINTPSPTPAPLLAISAANPPARHTLRIVYLNEIDNNPGPSARTIRQPGSLHLGTATATNTVDWTTTQQSLSIIKVKISSPNHR